MVPACRNVTSLVSDPRQALHNGHCATSSLMVVLADRKLGLWSPDSCLLCRPFFLPCFLAALVSLIALVSNTFMLTETLPRLVEAKVAHLQAIQKDEQAPLLANESNPSTSEVNGEYGYVS